MDEDRRTGPVAVVGGGIAGLAAAWQLAAQPGVGPVTLLEGSPRAGGKIGQAELAGLTVDTGADRVLAVRPEALELIRAVSLGDDLVAPETAGREVLVEGQRLPVPEGVVMGIPTDLLALVRSKVLDPAVLARIPLDRVLPRSDVGEDVSVGRYVGERLGPQVVDRLVAPALAAVHGGWATELSLRATMPRLFELAREERSVLAAAEKLLPRPGDGPRYLGLLGGLGRLVPALVAALQDARVTVRTQVPVRRLARVGSGWRLDVGSARESERLDVAGVVLAVPAPPAARLLAEVSLGAGVHLGEIGYASVATVVLAYRAAELRPQERGERALAGAGVHFAASEPRRILAADFITTQWGWLGARADEHGLELVRVLVGGAGRTSLLQCPDAELAELAHNELAFALQLGRATPVASVVTRWGGGLPQYSVGHVDRVAAIREALAPLPGLAVCGAAYDGPGIAACIGSAQRAVADVLASLPG